MDGGNILAPDRDAMRAMLARLAAPYSEPGGLFEIAGIRHGAGVTARHFPAGDADGMADFAASLNGGGVSIYVGAALRRDAPPQGRANASHVAATRWLWLDYDDADAATRGPAVLEAAGLAPAFTVITGTTPGLRLQCWLALSEPSAPDVAQALMKALAAATGADPAPTDAPRIMRLAGGVAWPKPKPGRVAELVTMRDGAGRALTIAEVERAVAALTPAAPDAPVASSDATAPVVRADGGGVFASLLASLRAPVSTSGDTEYGRAAAAAECATLRLVGEGGRNHALNRAAFRLGQLTPHLLTPETATAVLLDAAAAAGLTESESRATVASGLGDGACNPRHPESTVSTTAAAGVSTFGADAAAEAPATARERLGVRAFADDSAPVLADDWTVDDVIPREGFGVIYGAPGCGKTFTALDLALAVGGGADRWHGKPVDGGAVLYLSMEGGALFANRLAAWRKVTGGVAPWFFRSPANVDLRGPNDAALILEAAREIAAECARGFRLIVVDTLSRAMPGGNENSAEDMTRLIGNVESVRKALGCFVLIVHHSGKDEGRGMRGHSSLFGAVDTELQVSRGCVLVEKQRDGEEGERIGFRLEVVELGVSTRGRRVTSCVSIPAELADSAESREPKGAVARAVMRELAAFLAEPGCSAPNPAGVGFPEPGSHRCADVDAFVAFAAGRGVSPASKEKEQRAAVRDALQRLTRDGFAAMNAGKVWIPHVRV